MTLHTHSTVVPDRDSAFAGTLFCGCGDWSKVTVTKNEQNTPFRRYLLQRRKLPEGFVPILPRGKKHSRCAVPLPLRLTSWRHYAVADVVKSLFSRCLRVGTIGSLKK